MLGHILFLPVKAPGREAGRDVWTSSRERCLLQGADEAAQVLAAGRHLLMLEEGNLDLPIFQDLFFICSLTSCISLLRSFSATGLKLLLGEILEHPCLVSHKTCKCRIWRIRNREEGCMDTFQASSYCQFQSDLDFHFFLPPS